MEKERESGFYATSQDELLVVFGGKIRVDGYVIENGDSNVVKELALCELPDNHEIGEDVGMGSWEKYNEFHPVRLEFHDDRSIDVLIDQLRQLKSDSKEK